MFKRMFKQEAEQTESARLSAEASLFVQFLQQQYCLIENIINMG